MSSTSNLARRDESLNISFQASEPDLQNYVIALEAENLKLHKQIARLQADNLSKQHEITALEKTIKEETKKHAFNLTINVPEMDKNGGGTDKPDEIPPQEIKRIDLSE